MWHGTRSPPPQSPNTLVVIKALNVFLQNDLDADLERTLVENFQNEAIALDRVRHPNIISRLGHGTARDLRGTVFHYLVLEYLPGGDLARVCREKSLSFEQALNYLEQICAGLGHAHQNGIIHRDIKPQNLLLTADRKRCQNRRFRRRALFAVGFADHARRNEMFSRRPNIRRCLRATPTR
jgi:serine/threonine protein kinase